VKRWVEVARSDRVRAGACGRSDRALGATAVRLGMLLCVREWGYVLGGVVCVCWAT